MMISESIRIPVRVDSEMAELQRGGVGDGPDGGVRERRRAVPVQRAAGDRAHSWRPRPGLAVREDPRCEFLSSSEMAVL